MGAMQNNNQKVGKKGKARGSVNNANRLQAFTSGGGTGNATWGDCDPKRLQGVVEQITALGGAITFALSRDGGAHALTLHLDENKRTLWFNGEADLDEELDMVAAALDQMD